MSAYRNDGEKRRPRSEPRARPVRTELVFGLVMIALGGLVLGLWLLSTRRRSPTTSVARETAIAEVTATVSASASLARPAALSEQQHLATIAAISIAGAAQQSSIDDVARLAMAVADANTDPKTTCAQYDAAFVALRRAVLAQPLAIESGVLGDVTAELADLDAARCSPGTDAGT